MEKKIILNIRLNKILSLITMFVVLLIVGFIFFTTIRAVIKTPELLEFPFVITLLLMIIICVILGYYSYKHFTKDLIVFINPLKSNLFEKYGDMESIIKIHNEVLETTIYEDKYIVLSEKYIFDRKNFEKLVAYDDVVGIQKLISKTNYVIDGYSAVITDKYKDKFIYKYLPKEEQIVDTILLTLSGRCKNIKIGYNKDTKKSSSFKEIKKIEKEVYTCPDCQTEVEHGDKFCKNCSCKLEWN